MTASEQELASCLGDAVGSKVSDLKVIPGGDICRAYLATLGDGSRLFVKSRENAPEGMFETEARGLGWLAEVGALRVPQVVAVGEGWLALEFLPSAARRDGFGEELGRGLAQLHRAPCDGFGWSCDNFIGPLPQLNAPCQGWLEFYSERRLRPQLQRALNGGRAPRVWLGKFERLIAALPSFVPDEPPSRLHGDLWGGNLLVGPSGEPCLVDPAVYGGHREVDLAMMRLFEGFEPTTFAAYDEAYPLQPGFPDRVPLYQLYPLLVHLNLFGGSYRGSVERALDQLPG